MIPRRYDPVRDRVRSKAAADARNVLTREGARELAYELDDWWHSRGFPQVRHWTEETHWRGSVIATVKSNLVNGLPPKETA